MHLPCLRWIALAILATLPALVACEDPDATNYSPSLTMVRTGAVTVAEPPPIPEALYVPGINIKPEDYDIAELELYLTAIDLQAMQEIDDPVPLEKHKDYDYEAGSGSLTDALADEGSIEFDDVEQGAMGDCYLVAALSAAIYIDQDNAIRDGLIRDVRDENGFVTHYVVRFYDAWGTPQDIEVDADLVRKNGKVTYARSLDTRSGEEEWWVSLVEKAYADWHGGYESIGDGGWAGDVMQAITGSNATYRSTKHLSDKSVVDSIRGALDKNRPVVAGTFGKEDGVDYEGTNIYAWHAYSVLDAGQDEEEKYFVQLRNPWGEVEPAGNGEDDGIFKLEMGEFKRLYQGITLGGGYTVDHSAPGAVDDLAVAELLDGGVALNFTATGDDGDSGLAAAYDLRYSIDPIDSSNFYQATAAEVAGPQTPGTAERIEVEGLDNDSTYYLALRVEDESDNISPLSNVVEVTLGSTGDDDDDTSGDDDDDWPLDEMEEFEAGAAGWNTSGLFHLTDVHAASPTHAMWFGDETSHNYDTGDQVTGALTSPVVSLAGASAPTLVWEQILDVEDDASYDQAFVEVATAGGGYTDWTAVWERTGTATDWEMIDVDLGSYAGQSVQTRFRFDSVDEINNDYQGWFIDNVWITD